MYNMNNTTKKIENEELARCYTELSNSMARIFEANGKHTVISRKLETMASEINTIRTQMLNRLDRIGV